MLQFCVVGVDIGDSFFLAIKELFKKKKAEGLLLFAIHFCMLYLVCAVAEFVHSITIAVQSSYCRCHHPLKYTYCTLSHMFILWPTHFRAFLAITKKTNGV